MVWELLAQEKEHGGSVCSIQLNVFLLGTFECAAVLGMLTHPHVVPETQQS